MSHPKEPIYFCTDIETSGQSYSTGSMLTLGCVPVLQHEGEWNTLESFVDRGKMAIGFDPNFYIRMKRRAVPDDKSTMDWWAKQSPEAYEEAFTMEPRFVPCEAMNLFISHVALVRVWSGLVEPELVFVSAPISFDFDFVRNYLYQYCKWNPFGDPGQTLDPKSYMAGMLGITIKECTIERFEKTFGKIEVSYKKHHALDDAKHVAARLVKMLGHMPFRQNHL